MEWTGTGGWLALSSPEEKAISLATTWPRSPALRQRSEFRNFPYNTGVLIYLYTMDSAREYTHIFAASTLNASNPIQHQVLASYVPRLLVAPFTLEF